MRTRIVHWVLTIGSLLALAYSLLPAFQRAQYTTDSLTVCGAYLRDISFALEMYSTDHDNRYPRNLNELVPKYLDQLPKCREAGYTSYRYEQGFNTPGNGIYKNYYNLECTGSNHKLIDYAPNYPRYDGLGGLMKYPSP